MKDLVLKIVLICIFICLLAGTALGSGFDCSIISAHSFSQGNAVVAHTDDASAIFFNPALINKLDSSQINIGTSVLFTSGDFRSNETNQKYELKDTTHFLPTSFATYKFNDRVTAGLGVFSNFGLSTTWDEDWEGRYISTKSKLTTITINPIVSVKLYPNIYLAGGIDIFTFDVELNKHINLSSVMLPDIKQKMSGDDVDLGYNLGLLVDLTENLSFGASYRSGIKVDVDGEVKHKIPTVVPPQVAAMFPNTSASASIELPPQAFVGIAYKGLKPFVFEIGGKWYGWSSYDELRIKIDKPIMGNSESVTPKEWEDSYYVNFGAQYQASEAVTLNAGYIYDMTPMPDKTFEPAIPDNDAHVFTLGTDIDYKNFTFGLMYSFKKYEDRKKDNSVDDNPTDDVINPVTSANGKYKNSAHFIAFNIAYRF